ncbi:MarR family winged helix-turn-helix transcriptional regulator [Micromonospora sp. NBC_01699]|uniref:MarR family winged helix-turn-helix transcriptional regulator n=1 Tax=Micromonospora sp. NBC_01699 TaxID=2975984 RepID=UPI002E2D37E8|nr:MarR family winged helix-turn-helix transcriptional regulator [Micromonospora sp. NBC_01699]
MAANGERWLSEREQRAWRSFITMQMELQSRLNRQLLADTGLSESDYAVLVHLSEAPGMRLRIFQLRAHLQWEKTRLTHHLGRMARRGLVEREPCVTDPRGAFILITDTGLQEITRAAPKHVSHVRRWVVDVLTPEQLDALAEISDIVRAGFEQDTEPEPCDTETADPFDAEPVPGDH